MPYQPPIWSFESQGTRRARQVSALRAVQDQVSPLVAKGDALSLLQAQNVADEALQSPSAALVRQNVRNQAIGAQVKQQITAQQGPVVQTGDTSLIGKVGSAWRTAVPEGVRNALGEGFHVATSAERALDVLFPGEPGTAVGEFIGKAPLIGGALRTGFDVGLSPASLASAGLGAEVGAPALAALRGFGIAGRGLAAVAGPIVGGGFRANIAAQTAAAIGSKYGSEFGAKGAEALGGGEDAQALAGLAGGLVGGGVGIAGLQGAKAAVRGVGEQQAAEAIRAAAPEAGQYGRGAGEDLINPDFARGGDAFPVGSAEDRMNLASVDNYLRPRIGDDGIRALREHERRQLAGDLFAAERTAKTSTTPQPPIAGETEAMPTIRGGAESSREEFMRAMQEKAAAGETPTAEEHARLMNMLGETAGALPASEQAAAREAHYNDPANLGSGEGLSAEAQQATEDIVKRADQKNTITSALASAREQEPSALDTVIARNADELPEPTRTVPSNLAEVQARARRIAGGDRPTIGGGAPDLPGSEQPFLRRPSDPRIPTSSNPSNAADRAAIEAYGREIAGEPARSGGDYPYETFPGPKFGTEATDYTQGARESLPGDRPVSDYGRQGSLVDVPPTEERGSLFQNLKDLLSAPRALMTSGDIGGSTRQAGMLAPSHPRTWARAMVDQFQAYRDPERAQAVYDRINNHPLRPYLNRMGIEVTDATGDIARQEEAFQHGNSVIARAVQRVPLVERSARGYTTGMTSMRTGAAYDWLESKTPEQLANLSDETLRAMGGFFNAATGRGNLPEFLKDHAQTLNAAFFAPRNFIGHVQANLSVLSKNPEVRAEAAKSLAAFYGTGTAILGLAALGGAKVGLDPRGSDFGKIILPGGTRIDIWGGNQQIMRLIANLSTGQQQSTRTGDVYDQDRLATVGRFIKSKLAPVPSTVLAATQGQTTNNEQLRADPGSLGGQALRLVTPLFLQDLYDATANAGPVEGLAAGALSAVGVGANAYQKGPADALAQQTYGKPYGQLSGPERGELNTAYPELAAQLLTEQAKAAGSSGQAAQVRQNTYNQQQASDDQLLRGKITRQQWNTQRGDRAQRERGALEAIYGPAQAITDAQAQADPLKRYLKAIADTTDPATGVVDAAALAAQRQSWGPEVNAQVDKSLGTSDTPLERLYREAAANYYGLSQYRGVSAEQAKQINALWTEARAGARSSSDLDMARSLRAVVAAHPDLDPAIVAGVRRRIAGTLVEDSKRKTLATRDPLAAFFFGSKALNPSQRDALTARLGQGAAA